MILPVPRPAGPTRSSRIEVSAASLEQIVAGRTTRTEVLLLLGEPDGRADLDRWFTYGSRVLRGGVGWAMWVGQGVGTLSEQMQLFDAFLSRTRLVEVYYRWRQNLRDEGNNHVLELAVAAGDAPIVTFNRRDFRGGELRFPSIVVQTPSAWLNSQGFS